MLIHATNDARDLNKRYATDVPILADAKLFLQQLADELRGRVGETERTRRREVAATIKPVRQAWLDEYESDFADDSAPINGYRMFRELWNTARPEPRRSPHESGASRDIQSVFYPATTPRSYLGWGHSTQLGFSLGLCLGAKLANPDRTVVNVMGDGAIGMTGMDLETASRENIPILTVIKHDSIFCGLSANFPVANERYKAIQQGGDYAALARSLGLAVGEGGAAGPAAGGVPARAGRDPRRPAGPGRRDHRRRRPACRSLTRWRSIKLATRRCGRRSPSKGVRLGDAPDQPQALPDSHLVRAEDDLADRCGDGWQVLERMDGRVGQEDRRAPPDGRSRSPTPRGRRR